MAHANLQSGGVSSIAEAFVSAFAKQGEVGRGRKVHKLTELDLTQNQVGDEGSVALARALKRMPHLVKLAFLGNQPGRQGLGKLVTSLAQCLELQVRT